MTTLTQQQQEANIQARVEWMISERENEMIEMREVTDSEILEGCRTRICLLDRLISELRLSI